MSFLKNRLNKIEDRLEARILKKVFFWRDDPKVPGETEKRFRKNTPDLENYDIYVYSFGKKNLNKIPVAHRR